MSKLITSQLNGDFIVQHRDSGAEMNAVIIYEQCDLALKANAMLERAALSVDGFRWDVRPWRMQFILSPASGDLPLVDAAEADLIVLAFRNPSDLSPQLMAWLETWAGCRSVQHAGLAIFDGSNGDMLVTAMANGLAHFASRHGLCLLAGDGDDCPEFDDGLVLQLT